MVLWYSRGSTRDTGKFRAQKRMGVAASSGDTYREWSYEFVQHQRGSTVRRTYFSVSIRDPNGNRAEYLRDFSSLEKAAVAAREWIDDVLKRKI